VRLGRDQPRARSTSALPPSDGSGLERALAVAQGLGSLCAGPGAPRGSETAGPPRRTGGNSGLGAWHRLLLSLSVLL